MKALAAIHRLAYNDDLFAPWLQSDLQITLDILEMRIRESVAVNYQPTMNKLRTLWWAEVMNTNSILELIHYGFFR